MNRKDPERCKRVLSAIKEAVPDHFPVDAVHAVLLEEAAARPIDFVLPRPLKKALYRYALPVLGLRPGARAVAALVVTIALLGGLKRLDALLASKPSPPRPASPARLRPFRNRRCQLPSSRADAARLRRQLLQQSISGLKSSVPPSIPNRAPCSSLFRGTPPPLLSTEFS
jgi:hypothetical protein